MCILRLVGLEGGLALRHDHRRGVEPGDRLADEVVTSDIGRHPPPLFGQRRHQRPPLFGRETSSASSLFGQRRHQRPPLFWPGDVTSVLRCLARRRHQRPPLFGQETSSASSAVWPGDVISVLRCLARRRHQRPPLSMRGVSRLFRWHSGRHGA